MAGTAGSKYGIVHDDLPLNSDFKSPLSQKQLKDLRRILRRKRSARNRHKSATCCDLDNRPPVFISYAQKNRKRVRQVVKKLIAADIKLWVDYRNLFPLVNMPVQISAALRCCNIVLLFWSEAASQSRWVEREWSCAVARNKRIIVCILNKSEVPDILACEAFIDFRNFNQGLAQLLHALGR